jgi:hypothetical protein
MTGARAESTCGSLWVRFIFFAAVIVALLSLPLFFARGIGVADDSTFLVITKYLDAGFGPYTYFKEHHPPGIYVVLYFLKMFFGEAWWVSRIFILALNLLLSFATAFFIGRRKGVVPGVLGAIFMYVALLLFHGYCLHAEHLCALFGLAAFAVIYQRETVSLGRVALFGILVALASFFKLIGFLYLCAYIIFLLVCLLKRKAGLRRILVLSIVSIFSFLSFWVVIIAILALAKNLYSGLIEWAIIDPLFIYTSKAMNASTLKLFLASPLFFILATGIILAKKYGRGVFNGVPKVGGCAAYSADDISFMGLNATSGFSREDNLFLALFAFLPLLAILKRPSDHYVICALPGITILSVYLWLPLAQVIFVGLKKNLLKLSRQTRCLCAAGVIMMPALLSLIVSCGMGYFFIRENRLKTDREFVYETSKIISYWVDQDEPIACLSAHTSCSRILYILERRPLLPLYSEYYLGFKERAGEILKLLKERGARVVILEHTLRRGETHEEELSEVRLELEKGYVKIPLKTKIDLSRKTMVELYILKGIKPVRAIFKSNIFPQQIKTDAVDSAR